MRLKRLFTGLALAASITGLQAQDFSQAVVQRGPINELQYDSVAVWIKNTGIRSLNLTGMWSCAQWGDSLLSPCSLTFIICFRATRRLIPSAAIIPLA